jgi:NAD(P)-dependent dehydrogenase (short-subunit alcohol dehydrogenase family)
MSESSGRFAGRVALITGAAGGQGQRHAERFAAEGADIIALDRDDPDETRRRVEALGRRCIARFADVTRLDDLTSVVESATAEAGRLDIVCANAGVAGSREHRLWEITEQDWVGVMNVNLFGVWATIKAATPRMIEAANGGSVLIIGSTTAYSGYPHTGHYTTSKHALIGLLRVLANELGQYSIRVNAVHPSFVDTPLAHGPDMYERFTGSASATREQFEAVIAQMHMLPVGLIPPDDVSNALLWLASDEARYVTAASLPVDAGAIEKAGGS